MPGLVSVTHEAGPTGFGSARYLAGQGIECLGSAPSRLQRPSGDRVKTDVRDARHLVRLPHLGEIVAVTVPSVEQEAARDLVRAREDVRGDLMSARHRLSKLLLLQRIVYYGGESCTGSHDLWLRGDGTTVGGDLEGRASGRDSWVCDGRARLVNAETGTVEDAARAVERGADLQCGFTATGGAVRRTRRRPEHSRN